MKQAVESVNNPYNPIGWIPGLRPLLNVGADQRYSRLTGQNFTPYTIPAAFSAVTDGVLPLRFGLGPMRNLATSYVGNVVGGLVGEQYGHPELGSFFGGFAGGFAPNIYHSMFTP